MEFVVATGEQGCGVLARATYSSKTRMSDQNQRSRSRKLTSIGSMPCPPQEPVVGRDGRMSVCVCVCGVTDEGVKGVGMYGARVVP